MREGDQKMKKTNRKVKGESETPKVDAWMLKVAPIFKEGTRAK